jgi:hypothetical protein
MFHRTQDFAGVAPGRLPSKLVLKWKFETDRAIKSSPAVWLDPADPTGRKGRVFVGSNDSNVYAVDLADGSKLWSFKTGDTVEGTPLVLDGVVYVGGNTGFVYALDAATGTMKWALETGDSILGGINWAKSPDGRRTWILAGSRDSTLYCIDAATGKAVWKCEVGSYINGGPVLAGDKVIFGGSRQRPDPGVHCGVAGGGRRPRLRGRLRGEVPLHRPGFGKGRMGIWRWGIAVRLVARGGRARGPHRLL